MTLNYWMMVERYPNLKEEVGDSIPACEISSLLDKKLVRWSTAFCALALVSRTFVSKRKKKIRHDSSKLITTTQFSRDLKFFVLWCS
jgi:hypothetical protein